MNKELYAKLLDATNYINIVTTAPNKIANKENEPERIKQAFYDNHQFKAPGLHALLSAVSWIVAVFSVCLEIALLQTDGGIGYAMFAFFFSLLGVAGGILLRVDTIRKVKARDELCVKTTAPLIQKSKAELIELKNELSDYITRNEYLLDFIPVSYRNSQAISYMFVAVANGRADTLKEAVELYETQLHRWRLEDSARQAAEAQRYNALAMQELSRQQARNNDLLERQINNQREQMNLQEESLRRMEEINRYLNQ